MNIPNSITKLFGAKVGSKVVGFIALAYLSRSLGPSSIGVFFLFQSSLSILSILADLGLREGIEKRISEGGRKSDVFSTGAAAKFGMTGLISVFILVFSSNINQYIGGHISHYLILALFLHTGYEIVNRVLRGELRVEETATLRVVRQLLWALLGVGFVSIDLGYQSLIYSTIIGLFVSTVIGIRKINTSLGSFSKEAFFSLWSYSKYSFVGAVGGTFYSWLDVALIGFFLSQTEVGGYEVAWRIGAIVTVLSTTIGSTIFPQISYWKSENERGKISSLVSKTIVPSLILVLPSLVGVTILSKSILTIIFGKEFGFASEVLVIFMFINIFQAIAAVSARSVRAAGHPRIIAQFRLLSISLNIILNIVLINYIGLIGAAWATGTAIIVYTVLSYKYLDKIINIEFPTRKIIWCGFSSLSMGTIIWVLTNDIVLDNIYTLTLMIVFGATSYFLILILYRPLRIEIIALINDYT